MKMNIACMRVHMKILTSENKNKISLQ